MNFSETGLPQDKRLEKAFERYATSYKDDPEDMYFQWTLETLKLVADSNEIPPIPAMCAYLLMYEKISKATVASPEAMKTLDDEETAEFGEEVMEKLKELVDATFVSDGDLPPPDIRTVLLASLLAEARNKLEILGVVRNLSYDQDREYAQAMYDQYKEYTGTNRILETRLDETLGNIGRLIIAHEERLEREQSLRQTGNFKLKL